MKLKRIFAALLAGAALLALVGCGTSGSTGKPASSAASTPKDYTQILHDARSAEDNEYYMIFTKGADGNTPLSTATARTMRPTSSMMRSPT